MSGPVPENMPSKGDIENFCSAAKHGDIDYVRKMLGIYGDNVVNQKDVIKMTALAWAAHSGETEIVRLLLDNGAFVDESTYSRGCTALAWAAYKGETETVEFLLRRGADPSKKNSEGQTPTDIARQQHYVEIADTVERWIAQQEEEKRERAHLQERESVESCFDILREKRPPVPSLVKKPFPKP